MEDKNNQSSKKNYRLVQPEGKISWRIEELWEGGVERGPFGNQEAAIKKEEEIARAEGFIDDLVLLETVATEISHKDAFRKNADGSWKCVMACSITMENTDIVFEKDSTFTGGTLHMGVDVTKWLDENM